MEVSSLANAGFKCFLVPHELMLEPLPEIVPENILELPGELNYLDEGDVILLKPQTGELFVLYRRASSHNTLLLTEKCNNNCVMCSQPPKQNDDNFKFAEIVETIKLIDPSTPTLGISGGEPSLLGNKLLEIIRTCRNYLPRTSIHLLSNGRAFKNFSFVQQLAAIKHPDLMIGVPINSDIPDIHDYIVQAKGAFDESILGLMNLKRFGIRVEIRIVIHRQNVERLVSLGEFIARNLTFCDHVAMMGMEIHGHALANRDLLWIDPFDYRKALQDAVLTMTSRGMCVSIFNLPLCLLDRQVWRFAKRSISDWKVHYLDECKTCTVRNECSGLFGTSHGIFSGKIRAIQ
jgi:His-Xaa-Ser system radical SAM maturase HxsC